MNATRHDPHEPEPISGNEQDARLPDKDVVPSVGLAGFLVAAVVFVNEANFRTVDSESLSVDWQILLRMAVCGGCGLYAWKYLSTAWAALNRFPAAWITILAIWCIFTVPFAINVPYAAVACANLWCVILFAPVALVHLGPKRLLMVVFGSLAAFAVVSFFVYFAVPSLGRTEFVNPNGEITYRLGGLSHANGLGQQMALMVMIGLVLGSQKTVPWRTLTAGFILALIALYLTNSRTSMLATASAAVFLCFQTAVVRGALNKVLIFAALGGMVIAGAAIVQGGFHIEKFLGSMSRSGNADEMYNFTGRTEIWQFAMDRIAESPIFGHGCGCGRFPMRHFPISYDDPFPVGHAHNLLLNVMVETGIPGGMLLLVTLVTQIRAMFIKPSIFPDMLTIMVLVFGFAEAPLFSVVPGTLTLLWIIAIVWRPLVESQPAQAKEAAP